MGDPWELLFFDTYEPSLSLLLHAMSSPAEMTVTTPMDTVQSYQTKNKSSMFKKLAENPLQKMQIETYRLTFLLNCRGLKRPPCTLRATGFKALNEVERIQILSDMESAALQKAIAAKKKEIKLLKRIAQRSEKVLCPLSNKQKKRIKKHFNKKILFYQSKELTDWRLWPKKYISQKAKQRNTMSKSRRNFKRKSKKIETQAKHLIDSGSVRILVDVEVPPSAIVVLGKGLGFVPTPKANAGELRLDARRVVNKLLYKKTELLNEEETSLTNGDDSQGFQLPSKLRQTSYFQAAVTNTDPEINMAINHITTNVNSVYFNKKKQCLATTFLGWK